MTPFQEQTFISPIRFDRVAAMRLTMFVLQIAAFWATWHWLALRIWTSAEEHWGILALAAATFFAFFSTRSEAFKVEPETNESNRVFSNLNLLPATFFTLIYAASGIFNAPSLAQAVLAMTAITFVLSRWRFRRNFHFGLFGLLILALPSIASLQFFLGYPLRVVVGKAAAWLLRMQGLDVWREGVCLHFGEKLVWIDAPCSGIKMLWFGLFLAAVIVCFHQLSNLKTLAVFASAFLIILLGNIFRASALFYIEAEIISAPTFMHEAVGVFSFVFVAIGIAYAARVLDDASCKFFKSKSEPMQRITVDKNQRCRLVLPIGFAVACLIAFSATLLFSSEKTFKKDRGNFQGFPATFENLPLKQLDLSEREKFFLEDFPGSIGRFSDGRREIIIRFVTEATRKLHPAGDCFRAIGYATKPLPLKVDGEGKRWSCFSAVKSDEKLRVCERIHDTEGGEWTDVSAWYWSAINETKGEWWAITVAENEL